MMNEKSQSEEASAATEPVPKKPSTWWQWLLIYPALLIAILGSIPTYWEMFRSQQFGVAFGESASAKQQNSLWEKNITCLRAPEDWYENEYNIRVDATICRSGDILIMAEDPKGDRRYMWVSINMLLPRRAAVSLLSEAYAAEHDLPLQITQTNVRVICQRVIATGRVLRRIQTPNGCYDEIINTYTGAVIQRNPAPCNPSC